MHNIYAVPYRNKVWPRFERDIINASGRKEHFIPVILDKSISSINLGISDAIGSIYFTDEYQSLLTNGMDGKLRQIIKTKIVNPIIEKISQYK